MSTQSAFFSSTYPRGLITRLCGLAWMVWMLWEGAHKMLQGAEGNQVPEAFQTFCMDCHDSDTAKGNLDLEQALKHPPLDASLSFEQLITGGMPPAEKPQPGPMERHQMLTHLANRQTQMNLPSSRRLSRQEFIHSVNDLLGLDWDLSEALPTGKGTFLFDSDRRILPTEPWMAAVFHVTDRLLNRAFPSKGFPAEQRWVTQRLRHSHDSYDIYTRPTEEGILFSWTRANNGNSYSFFYDDFEPPLSGWYEIQVEAKKQGAIERDISIEVYAGKYYFADDRPQPQRLLGVLSLSSPEIQPHTLRARLHPGDQISIHCYAEENFREQDPERGALIRQISIRGPLVNTWPPTSLSKTFAGFPLKVPERIIQTMPPPQTHLQAIGGGLQVSSFQEGMEKEYMQDGIARTFWHSRFKPEVASPPHFVILENPHRQILRGLLYSTWTGGNGNGQVKTYRIQASENGSEWGPSIAEGDLDVQLAHEQTIAFKEPIDSPFLRFEITDALSLDGRSIASIGELDVLVDEAPEERQWQIIEPADTSVSVLQEVILRFAKRALGNDPAQELIEASLAIAQRSMDQGDPFLTALKAGLKTLLCSPSFLMTPIIDPQDGPSTASTLARILWLSVPDDVLIEMTQRGPLNREDMRGQILRMLQDARSQRMVRSFVGQWLGLDGFDQVTPSLKLYPAYDTLLHHFLPKETEMFMAHLMRENLTIDHLIDSDISFLNQRLARHYCIEGVVGAQMRRVRLDPASHRGGLLTMGSILKMTTDGFESSPIRRGAWVSKQLMGNPLPPPPPSVPTLEPHHGLEASLKEQINQHTQQAACRACHKIIDPYGFGLESFDASGQWRERYRVIQPHSGTFQYRPEGYYQWADPVDASGTLQGQSFRDIQSMKALLRQDLKKVAYHFAKVWFHYASGAEPTLHERIALHAMIPEDPSRLGMADLMTKVLIHVMRNDTR